MATQWIQSSVTLPALRRGCHLVSQNVLSAIPQLNQCRVGVLHVFIRHTSASLTINENADPDVPEDLAMALDRVAPEAWPYRHTCEGPDDMPAHVKTALTDSSLSIPVANGRLLTGTWQGIYLCEHRDNGGARKLILTLHGEFDSSDRGVQL
jgi:secondary thiamine-phosphate synthase enzyme